MEVYEQKPVDCRGTRARQITFIKRLKILLGIVLWLVFIETALEFRAHHRGWGTLLFGEPRQVRLDRRQAGVSLGPTKEFPFRSPIVAVTRDPGVQRIWIASASHGEDIYLPPESIFPHLAAVGLSGRGRPSEVLNASRASFTISDNLDQLKAGGTRWRPDVAILYQMSLDINQLSRTYLGDIEETPSGRPHVESDPGQSVFDSEWLVKLGESTTVYPLLKEHISGWASGGRILAVGLGPAAEEKFGERVLRFVALSEELGIEPVLCTFAASHDQRHLHAMPPGTKKILYRYNIYLSADGWIETVASLNERIRRIASQRDLRLIDLGAEIGGRSELFRDFVHFNRRGHREVAKAIITHLLESPARGIGSHPAQEGLD